jgi:hypothetical protein
MVNHKRSTIAGLILIVSLTGFIFASPSAGPGITVTYNSAIRDKDVDIKNAFLPDGMAFPHGGSIGGPSKANDNPLSGGATMGAAPDGRGLPEYIDFEWRESPKSQPDPTPMDPVSQAHKDWETKIMADFYSHPIKKQRVFIRNRIPTEVVNAVIDANRHAPKGRLNEASIQIFFIWTEYGIKLRWQIWHRPPSGVQYYSHQGGDEIVPAGTTMIASYASTIKKEKYMVALTDGYPIRYPASASGTFFSGGSGLGYTNSPIHGGGKLVAFESEPELPEWIDLRWALFPTAAISQKSDESSTAFHWRSLAFYSAVPRKNERILVRSRVPQEVRDEITAATRNAQPHKIASSLIYIYFIWTENGIKLHWRLKRSQPDGSFISVREGGDELTQTETQ